MLKLAWRAQRDPHQNKFTKVVDTTVKALENQDLTKTTLERNKASFTSVLKQAGANPAETHRPKEYPFQYLGVALMLPVNSLLDYYNNMMECLVRSRGVDKGAARELIL